MNKQIQYEGFKINDLSELIEVRAPKGVLILEGDLKTWKDDGSQEGSLTKSWVEAIKYVSTTCNERGIPHYRMSEQDLQIMSQPEDNLARKFFEERIASELDMALYIAGCLCCIETGRSGGSINGHRGGPSKVYVSSLKHLENLFGRGNIFVASSKKGQNAPYKKLGVIPNNGYFLV